MMRLWVIVAVATLLGGGAAVAQASFPGHERFGHERRAAHSTASEPSPTVADRRDGHAAPSEALEFLSAPPNSLPEGSAPPRAT